MGLHIFFFLAAFLIIVSRGPDRILNPQFFAEDGKLWYAQAYEFGVRSLVYTDGGYLHLAARLVAMVALLFPFSAAPLVITTCAIALQALPVNVFLSSRFSEIAFPIRALGSLLYLGLPNSYGVSGKAATLQWHLTLLACLFLLAKPASTRKWRSIEAVVFILVSIESPLGILLLPIAAILWWRRRSRWYGVSLALLVPGTVVQLFVILTSHSRQFGPNGASADRLISILGRQVFLASLVGRDKVLGIVLHHPPHFCFLIETSATALGILILLYALRYAPFELKLFIGFSFSVLALSLARPLAGAPDKPQWEWLRFPGTSNRYFYFPILSFVAVLLWLAVGAKPRFMRVSGLALLFACSLGVLRDWRYPALDDMHFSDFAQKFREAARGTTIVIPINPPPWTMELTKK